jgi:prepilin-type N-terminal cleavage/methylation domain-containing protein
MIAREVHDAVKQTNYTRPKCRAYLGQGGFTLLEIIITIVIAAIMGVFFAQFVYTGVIHSADPVRQVQNMSTATQSMESMSADYKKLAATQSNFLATFKDYVEYGNGDTTQYPGKPAGYPKYGSYEKVYNNYVVFDGSRIEKAAGPTEQNILKVTIRCGNQTATALFTR